MAYTEQSQSEERWLLFLRSVADDETATLKSATRAALALEDQFLVKGWPVGDIYANLSAVRAHLNVGRRVCYDAMGILEMRGSAYMRRGPGGGLVVATPTLEKVTSSLLRYLALKSVTIGEVVCARDTLYALVMSIYVESRLDPGKLVPAASNDDRSLPLLMAEQLDDRVLQFFLRLIEDVARAATETQCAQEMRRNRVSNYRKNQLIKALKAGDTSQARALMQKLHSPVGIDMAEPLRLPSPVNSFRHLHVGKYALEVAEQILRDIPKLAASRNGRLGSETEIAERYGRNDEVIRQAVRILEDMGVIHTRRGRGGGLVRNTPPPNSVIRQIYSHLVGLRVDVKPVMTFGACLGAEVAAQMAQHPEVLCMQAPLLARRQAQFRAGGVLDMRQFIEFEHSFLNIFANPILAICLRSVALYIAWIGGREPDMQSLGVRYFPASSDFVAALVSHDAAGARQIQEFKTALFKDFIYQRERASSDN